MSSSPSGTKPGTSCAHAARGQRRTLGHILLCAALFAGSAAPFSGAAGEPIETPAYREMIRADQSREAGQGHRALAQYREAVRLFETLQRNYPDYKPATIEYRRSYCRDQIRRLETGDPELATETPDSQAMIESTRAEAERWQAEAEKLSMRVLELETAMAALRDRSEEERAPAPRQIQPPPTPSRPAPQVSRPPRETTPHPPPLEHRAQERSRPAKEAPLQAAWDALKAGQTTRALNMFQQLVNEDPEASRRGFLPWRRRTVGGDLRARYGLARSHQEAGDLRVAARMAAQLAREYPEQHDYAHLEGNIARQRQKHPSAARHFARAVELAPDRPSYRFDYATALHTMGQYREAIEQYQKLMVVEPDHGLAHFNLAALLVGEGIAQQDAARAHYEKALELGERRSPMIERRLSLPSSPSAARP